LSEKSNDIEVSQETGLAVVKPDAVRDPGIEPHRIRMTDKSPKHARNAARQVALLFALSMLGSAFALWAYFAFPINEDLTTVRQNTLFLGLGITFGLLGIGIGSIHWAKTLMPDHEVAEDRHLIASPEEKRAAAIEIINLANQESGFTRRKLIRRTLYGALALFPLPGLIIFGDLGPNPGNSLRHTKWKAGTRLARDPYGTPIKASDVTIGSVYHVVPEGLVPGTEHYLEEKAKAAVLLVRVEPDKLIETE